jgi:dTDP-4-amino-4,6-dideoxygalactose transaminase
MSIPEHPYYRQRFAWNPEKWPNAMRIGRQTVSLPLSPKVGPEDAAYIVDSVSDIVLRHGR